jgi:hypothetical protein
MMNRPKLSSKTYKKILRIKGEIPKNNIGKCRKWQKMVRMKSARGYKGKKKGWKEI